MIRLTDKYSRIHDYLRISLTDRCNLNCIYCNPKKDPSLQKSSLLTFEELYKIIDIFVKKLGIRKIRFTGGEPFARKEVLEFFSSLIPLKKEYNLTLGITTNGTLINGKLKEIKEAGIDSINISLDTLNAIRFTEMTGAGLLDNVLSTITEAEETGFVNQKINSVVIRGKNDDELTDFIDHFKNSPLHLRFIEYMPSRDNDWGTGGFISAEEMRNIIIMKYEIIPLTGEMSSVSKNYILKGYPLTVGFITPLSDHFCTSCNRLRINASGDFKTCLFSAPNDYINFKNLFAFNYSNEEICALIVNSVQGKWKKHPGMQRLLQLRENNMLRTGG